MELYDENIFADFIIDAVLELKAASHTSARGKNFLLRDGNFFPPLTQMSTIANASKTVINDQIGYYSDMTLWEIRIGGLVLSVVSGLATASYFTSDCGSTSNCPSYKLKDCGVSQCGNEVCKSEAKAYCAKKGKGETVVPNQTPECQKNIGCHNKGVLYGIAIFFLGFILTMLANTIVAIRHGHGRAIGEQMLANAIFSRR